MADIQTNPQNQTSNGVNTDITGAFPTQAPAEEVTLPQMNLEPEIAPMEEPAFQPENPVQPEVVPTPEPAPMPTIEPEVVPESTPEITPEVVPTTEPEIIDNSQDEIISEAQTSLDMLADPSTQTETLPEMNLTPEIAPEPEAIVVPETIIPATTPVVEAVATDDPFMGLNIVFNEPTATADVISAPAADQTISNTPETTPVAEVAVDKPFLDPFLAKKEEVVTTPVTPENTNQASLDSMLENLDTATVVSNPTAPSLTSSISSKIGGLDGKKKKMLLVGSGILGIAVLAGASYMVFSTMFPSNDVGGQLQADINGPAVETGDDEATDTPAIATGSDDVLGIGDTEVQEEVLGEPADSFGNEDQLPPTAVLVGTEEPVGATVNAGDEEELTANVSPENDTALKTLDEHVDKLKQLLSLAKSKNDNASIKQIALTLKAIRSVKEKIVGNTYTSFSTEIEPDMTKINFDIDQLTASLVQ